MLQRSCFLRYSQFCCYVLESVPALRETRRAKLILQCKWLREGEVNHTGITCTMLRSSALKFFKIAYSTHTHMYKCAQDSSIKSRKIFLGN